VHRAVIHLKIQALGRLRDTHRIEAGWAAYAPVLLLRRTDHRPGGEEKRATDSVGCAVGCPLC
jgi:hypothetical protein